MRLFEESHLPLEHLILGCACAHVAYWERSGKEPGKLPRDTRQMDDTKGMNCRVEREDAGRI